MRIVGLAAMVVVGVAQPSLAEDLPRFDIRSFCAVSASSRGGSTACQRQEETMRIQIAARWTEFPKQRKHFCVQSVSFRPKDQRSYVSLAECLDEAKTS